MITAFLQRYVKAIETGCKLLALVGIVGIVASCSDSDDSSGYIVASRVEVVTTEPVVDGEVMLEAMDAVFDPALCPAFQYSGFNTTWSSVRDIYKSMGISARTFKDFIEDRCGSW